MHSAPPRVHRLLPNLSASLVLLAPLAGLTARAQSGYEPYVSGGGSGDRGGFIDAMPRQVERLPVFFPPNPPPLGRPAARGVYSSGTHTAPAELALHVSEFYYPALGTRLATGKLPDTLRRQLDAYRAAKLALQSELRAELQRLAPADAAMRLEELIAFSRRQTPGIAELEKKAEQLRRDLATGSNDWSANRQWHLSSKHRRGYSPIEIAQVMRAYAFYEDDLLPAQRRLLREIAIELAFAAEDPAAAAVAQPYVFFPPEPARVLLPDDMPADLARKVAAYQTKKSTLKKELYDAVYAADGAVLGFLRAPLKALAGRQAARLAELDPLAEEIRRGLGELPSPPPPRSPLPAHLHSRVAAVVADFHRAQIQAVSAIESILAPTKELPMQASYQFSGDILKFVVIPTRGARGRTQSVLRRIEAVRSQLSEVADEYGRRVADLINERESIRHELAAFFHQTKEDDLDRALMAAMRLANEKRAEGSFAEYRTAVFEPGLSPEQRRLLFDGVVEQLDLPLPRGELQPSRRAETW